MATLLILVEIVLQQEFPFPFASPLLIKWGQALCSNAARGSFRDVGTHGKCSSYVSHPHRHCHACLHQYLEKLGTVEMTFPLIPTRPECCYACSKEQLRSKEP